MKAMRKTLSVMVAAGIVLAGTPSTLLAISAVSDPGAFGITVDPNASGTKVSGFITLTWDIERGTEKAQQNCLTEQQRAEGFVGEWVNNLYVVASMQKGSDFRPFNSNYADGNVKLSQMNKPDGTPGDPVVPDDILPLEGCFDRQDKQIRFLKYVIEQVIIPGFFECGSSRFPQPCPSYAVKRLGDILVTTDYDPAANSPSSGDAAVFEVELAVR